MSTLELGERGFGIYVTGERAAINEQKRWNIESEKMLRFL